MEDDIITGKKLNEARSKTTDEEVDKILKGAQEQLKRDMNDTTRIRQDMVNKVLKEQENKAVKEKAERLAKERADKEKADKISWEETVREKAEKDKTERLAKEKAEKEKAERLAKEKAEKEKAERLAKEKAEKEKAEKLAKEKAEKEKAEKLAKERAEKEKAEREALEKAADDIVKRGNINGNNTNRGKKEAAAAIEILEEPYIEDTYVDAGETKQQEPNYGLTVGDIIGGIFEFIWFIFKCAVVLTIVTGIVGFFLSRELMLRGRNGSLQCTEDMTLSSVVLENKGKEDGKVHEWLDEVTREKVTMESDDGYIFVARKIVTDENSNKWAVILHGYNGSMEDIYDIAMHYSENGYNLLMPDLRACGESEGSYIGMGWLDRLDVINWIDVILDENPSADVVVHGVGMGAEAAVMLSGEPLKSNIKAVVAEGVYTSAWDVVEKEFKVRHQKWPVFPVLYMLNPVAKVWGGYSLKEADAVKQVKKSTVPILLIQGGQDTYATEDMVKEINDNVASVHSMQIISAGTHDTCRYADPDTYYNAAFDFVNLYAGK